MQKTVILVQLEFFVTDAFGPLQAAINVDESEQQCCLQVVFSSLQSGICSNIVIKDVFCDIPIYLYPLNEKKQAPNYFFTILWVVTIVAACGRAGLFFSRNQLKIIVISTKSLSPSKSRIKIYLIFYFFILVFSAKPNVSCIIVLYILTQ